MEDWGLRPAKGDGEVTGVRVVQYGLGPIGQEIARLVAGRPGLSLVGGIDVDPDLVGRELGALLEMEPIGTRVLDDAEEVLASAEPDVVLHATGSSLERVTPQIERVIEGGADLISTCEELAWPFARHPELAGRIDRSAVREGVSVLGTGVNPGFVMDKLAITLMGACQEIERVRVERVVDAARRREPLQRKVGAGLKEARFREMAAAGDVRHVGLSESALMVADVMGLDGEKMEEEIRPVIAKRDVTTPYMTVHKGEVAGVEQVATVTADDEQRIRLTLRMYVGAEGFDRVIIDGVPPIDMTVDGGVHGDRATAAIVVNCIPAVLDADPGLRTMLEIPLRYARLPA